MSWCARGVREDAATTVGGSSGRFTVTCGDGREDATPHLGCLLELPCTPLRGQFYATRAEQNRIRRPTVVWPPSFSAESVEGEPKTRSSALDSSSAELPLSTMSILDRLWRPPVSMP